MTPTPFNRNIQLEYTYRNLPFGDNVFELAGMIKPGVISSVEFGFKLFVHPNAKTKLEETARFLSFLEENRINSINKMEYIEYSTFISGFRFICLTINNDELDRLKRIYRGNRNSFIASTFSWAKGIHMTEFDHDVEVLENGDIELRLWEKDYSKEQSNGTSIYDKVALQCEAGIFAGAIRVAGEFRRISYRVIRPDFEYPIPEKVIEKIIFSLD